MDYLDIYKAISLGKAILICGAGFSYNSTNVIGKHPPIGNELLDIMLSELRPRDDDDTLETVADEYIQEFRYAKTISLLEKQYKIVKYDQFYNDFLALNWRRIYTTNYDDLIDIAVSSIGRQSKSTSDKPEDVQDKRGMCLHINGSIRTISSSNLRDQFKLTRSSYLTDSFGKSPWSRMFATDVETSDIIIVIGFSFQNDLDLNRYLFGNDNIKSKTFIITKPGEKESNLKRLNAFGNVNPIGVKVYSENVLLEKSKFSIPKKIKEENRCFQDIACIDENFETVNDKNIFKLLFYGVVDEGLLYANIDNSEYAVFRNKIDTTLKDLPNFDIIAVHSDLGNGKTLFTKILGKKLCANYSVYNLVDDKNIQFEIDDLIANHSKIVVIVDGYSKWARAIEIINQRKTDSVKLILTERSFSSKLIIDINANIKVVDLNVLSDSELQSLIQIIDKHPVMWNGVKFSDNESKLNFLSKKCYRSFQHILISLIKSQAIFNKFAKMINDKALNITFRDLLFIMIINSYFDLKLTSYEMELVTNNDGLFGKEAILDPEINEIFSLKENFPGFKSSILGLEISRKIVNSKPVFLVLRNIVENAYRSYQFDHEAKMREILKALNTYTGLRSLFDQTKDFKKSVTDYFEYIGKIEFFTRNAHYWLQYAICRIDMKEYDLAQVCFDNAYSYAKTDAQTIIYINNHYARYLLDRAITTNICLNPFKTFNDAYDALLTAQNIRNDQNYIFKVAQNFGPFFLKFKSLLSLSERQDCIVKVENIKTLIDKFRMENSDYYLAERKVVSECERVVTEVVKDLKGS